MHGVGAPGGGQRGQRGPAGLGACASALDDDGDEQPAQRVVEDRAPGPEAEAVQRALPRNLVVVVDQEAGDGDDACSAARPVRREGGEGAGRGPAAGW